MTNPRRFVPLLLALALTGVVGGGNIRPACAADDTLAQPPYVQGPDSQAQPNVPKGETIAFDMTNSKLYPGTQRTIWIYVPAQYKPEKPACLCVGLDGPGFNPQKVFDNLIAKGQMPITIGVFVSPGTVNKPGSKEPVRFDRCFEFDSTNDRFVRFFFDEVMPAVEAHKTGDGRAIRISDDPNDHMIYGASSGGVCAFTAAWLHPDRFRRVFTAIGTYVGMRGADAYPTLVRKTEPKPIRIYLQDGAADTWNPLFDNWYTQNRSMEESLHWANYDVNHQWGTLGHEGSHATAIFPDVVRWLWRDYPKPIEATVSPNSMLQSVLVPSNGWESIAGDIKSADCLAPGLSGEVYLHDTTTATIYRANPASSGIPPATVARNIGNVTAQAIGVDGRLYVAADGKIVALDGKGQTKNFAKGLNGVKGMFLSNDGSLTANVEGTGLVRIGADGHRTTLDSGVKGASGILQTPDHVLLFAIEASTHWIYSYVVAPDGSLQDKQRFYWLHGTESAEDADGENSGATDMAVDRNGNLYVATRMGVQVCDRNGRVEGILTLPGGAVTSLCFGGANFDELYIVCGGRLYRRQMRVAGVPPWASPMALPGFGAG